MADHLEMKLKQQGISIFGKEGTDTAEVIVHLFRPEVREFYQLERMWDTAGASEVVSLSADNPRP